MERGSGYYDKGKGEKVIKEISSTYKKEWKKIENERPRPHYLRSIITMRMADFVSKILEGNDQDAKELVDSIYSGDAYILKGAIGKSEAEEFKQKVINWSKTIKSEPQQMIDGCRNYHYYNDSISEKEKFPDGYTSVEHSYVFFRHNGDELGLFERLDEYWDAIKILSGADKNSFKKNIPSDGVIDRITFLQYPVGQGEITTHFDSSFAQKVLLGSVLAQIGEDYDYGENGFYLMKPDKSKVYIENEDVEKGDFVCVYPTMYHGVPRVTKSDYKQSEKILKSGRWYLQLYSPQSHEIKNREYTVAVNDE